MTVHMPRYFRPYMDVCEDCGCPIQIKAPLQTRCHHCGRLREKARWRLAAQRRRHPNKGTPP